MREKPLKEQKTHGQVSLYQHVGKGMLFPAHWHEEYELIHFYKGNSLLRVENTQFEMKEGSYALFNPGELHTVSATKDQESGIYVIVFKLSDVHQHFDNIFSDKAPLQAIFNEMQSDKYSHLYVKAQIYSLFYWLEKNDRIKSLVNKNAQFENIKNVLSFIEQNFAEKITMDNMSEAAGFSKYHFIRLFKAYTDTTPIKYLNQVRIAKAREILCSGDYDITTVGFLVGFENTSYFIKLFKETYGHTPGKFIVHSNGFSHGC